VASKRYCYTCDKYVLAQWSWAHPHPLLVLLILLSCGFLLPLIIFAPKSKYVCPKCLEKV
jgi:hypothetical protein